MDKIYCKHLKRQLTVLFFFLLQMAVLNGQNLNPQNLTNIIPPTPEVAAFAKYVDMPVGYSTGIPQVNIPIYTVINGNLSVPVSMGYNASGIKVEEAATWVGLGWNLSTGGSISRMVRGLPDDVGPGGYMHTTTTVQYILSLPNTSSEYADILSNQVFTANSLDVEPDIYIYSIMGYSGKFYYDQQLHQFVQTPYQAVKIQYMLSGYTITGWTLTLPNGVTCYMGLSKDGNRTGYDSFNNQSGFTNTNGTNGESGGDGSPAHITTWQVMDIVSPAARSIKYYYTSISAADFGRGGETKDYKAGSLCDELPDDRTSASFYKQFSSKAQINRISTDLCDVYFIPSVQAREDVLADPAASKRLDSIVVRNKLNQVVKAFSFDYSYFISTDITSINGMADVTAVSAKRLYLKSFTEHSSTDSTRLPYYFYYDTTIILPNRLSAAQDYWGYYNGKSNGTYLTPKLRERLLYGFGTGFLPGADRTVDFNYAKACSLKKIKYPTGGTTEYFFEKNIIGGNSYNNIMNGFQLSGMLEKSYFFYKSTEFQPPGTPAYTYIDTLEVGDISDEAQVIAQITGCASDASMSDDCPVVFYITGITDYTFYRTMQTSTSYVALPKGKYQVKAVTSSDADITIPDFSIRINWQENPDPNNYISGGMRVYKIVNTDGNGGKLIKRIRYNLFTDSTRSSGELVAVPVYNKKIYCGTVSQSESTVLRIVSNSIAPLASLDGQIIHYANVTEYYNDSNSYKTEYEFSFDYYGTIDVNGENYPVPTHVQRDWRKELMINKKVYEKVNAYDGYRILQWEQHFYNYFDNIEKTASFGIRVAPYATSGFGTTPYKFTTEWYLQDSTSTVQYTYQRDGTPGNTMVSTTKDFFDINNYYTVSNTRSVNSKGQVTDSRNWYPADYNNISGTNLASLQEAGYVQLPVKAETSRDGKLVNGQVVMYNNQGLPTEVYAYENSNIADTVAHDRNLLIPANYAHKKSLWYKSDYFTLLQAKNPDDQVLSFVWDYSGSYPIARVSNSDSASIAYTSFEADGSGYWSVGSSQRASGGVTGSNCYQMTNGNISKTGLTSATTYVVSYWTRSSSPFTIAGTITSYPVQGNTVTINGHTWTYYEHKIVGQSAITIAGTGYLDELRLFSDNAQMTTYTYQPLTGMSAQCDVDNRITYYEYDGLGRLHCDHYLDNIRGWAGDYI